MRTAVNLSAAFVLVASLSACSPEVPAEPQPPTPSVVMTTPGQTEAPPTAEVDLETPRPEPVPETTAASPAVPSAETSTTLAPVEQPTPQGGPWQPYDVTLRSGADVIRQTELPESLRAFLTSRIDVEDDAGCVTDEITLYAVHTDGYAFGSEESSCGGGHVVWGITDNQWHYLVHFGDAMPCTDLESNQIPPGVPELRCTGDDGTARDY